MLLILTYHYNNVQDGLSSESVDSRKERPQKAKVPAISERLLLVAEMGVTAAGFV